METNNVREGTFTSLKNSLGSPSNIYNPESQLLSEMLKDNSAFQSKRSSMSSFVDDQNQDNDMNKISYTNPFSNNIVKELSAELNRNFLLDSEDESNNEGNSKDVNELLLFKRKNNMKAPESTISDMDAQSSVYTDNDNDNDNENQTETQSVYSVTSSKDYRLDTEPLKDRIWYYRKPPTSNEKFTNDINNQMDDNQSYSDDSSTIDDSTAAIMQLKLHHYVSTNNLKVKKDNNPIVKRRTTISYSRFKPKLNSNFDFTHDINDIPLFSNKEFKTEAKKDYRIADTTLDDFNTSLLLNKTGDASRKRRSQLNQRSRTFSHAIGNENSSTITSPISSTSFIKESSNNNSFSNVSNNNKKQLHLNNPMDSKQHQMKTGNIDSGNTEKESQIPEMTDNSNQIFKVLMMAKDHILSLGGKIKRAESTTSRRSSIRKHQKKLRHNSRIRNRNHLKNNKKNVSIQSVGFHEQSDDEMTTVSSITDADKSTISHSSVLRKKPSSSGYLKAVNRKSSGPLSRNSSLLSISTRRSSLYNKNKFYQNDLSTNYSASNLSESSVGVEIDDIKKYDESFDLDVQNNTKNDKLRIYGVCPESYNSEYHEPIASSVDGRSSIYDYEEEESVVSESDNPFSSYANGGDIDNDIEDIRNKLNMMPITESFKTDSTKTTKIKNIETQFNDKNNNKNNNKTLTETKENTIKKPHKKLSTSTIETNMSSDSLTPTITSSNVNHLNNDNAEIKSEYTTDRTTIAGSTYGDNKSNATIIPRMSNNNFDGLYNFAGVRRNWDEETDSTYSRFNENESRHPLEIASMPDGIRESNVYPTIKQIPIPYYRYVFICILLILLLFKLEQ